MKERDEIKELVKEDFEKITEEIIEKEDRDDIDYMIYLLRELEQKYNIKAIITALQRELNLRERSRKEGGRPSIVEKYKIEIDAVFQAYEKKERIEERIKEILEEAKRRYSRATYFKIKKYAVEKISELKKESKREDMSYVSVIQDL